LIYKEFIVAIPYKPKNPKIIELTKTFVTFEKKLNNVHQKIGELKDSYEER